MDGDGPCSEIIHDVLFGRPKYRTCLNALRLSGVKPHRPSSIHGVVGGGEFRENSWKFTVTNKCKGDNRDAQVRNNHKNTKSGAAALLALFVGKG